MPGPKMGPRPADFDEDVIKQSPTYTKWQQLKLGEKLRYACREFVRGHADDEERLMRRIMIARRNNIRDHETLKHARTQRRSVAIQSTERQDQTDQVAINSEPLRKEALSLSMSSPINGDHGVVTANSKKRNKSTTSTSESTAPPLKAIKCILSDLDVEAEMDIQAVESTRSYQTWKALPNGREFVYNQKYVKGREGHEWLLKKNIWRRMRYRRENKKLVDHLRSEGIMLDPASNPSTTRNIQTAHNDSNNNNSSIIMSDPATVAASEVAAAAAAAASEHGGEHFLMADPAAIDAAVAAAESFGTGQHIVMTRSLVADTDGENNPGDGMEVDMTNVNMTQQKILASRSSGVMNLDAIIPSLEHGDSTRVVQLVALDVAAQLAAATIAKSGGTDDVVATNVQLDPSPPIEDRGLLHPNVTAVSSDIATTHAIDVESTTNTSKSAHTIKTEEEDDEHWVAVNIEHI